VDGFRAAESAVQHAKQRRYEEAYKILQGKKCDCAFVVRVYAETGDAGAAESALRRCSPNPSDVSNAAAALATRFATAGNIDAALKFAEVARMPEAYQGGEGYLAPALRNVAHAWVVKNGVDTVLNWARTRPTAYERAMALLGVAESVPNEAEPGH